MSSCGGAVSTTMSTDPGSSVDLRGVPTWYAEHGTGDPLVYLHGGFGDARELDRALDAYTAHFGVFIPERRGHGRTPDVEGAFTFPGFAADTVAFLEDVVESPAALVGYGDGATTALHVALERPGLARRLVLISGQLHADGMRSGFLDGPDAAAELAASPLAASYGELSPDGIEHFPVVAAKIVELARTGPALAAEQLVGVTARTLWCAATTTSSTSSTRRSCTAACRTRSSPWCRAPRTCSPRRSPSSSRGWCSTA